MCKNLYDLKCKTKRDSHLSLKNLICVLCVCVLASEKSLKLTGGELKHNLGDPWRELKTIIDDMTNDVIRNNHTGGRTKDNEENGSRNYSEGSTQRKDYR